MRTEKTEVLVVGAGPVGMFTALQLAAHDIKCTIIDREDRPAVHSYSCALHQQTLALLDEFDLIDDALDEGRRIETVAFYEGAHRRAEVCLSEINAAFPFILVLPQSSLETALEDALKKADIPVRWQHRFSSVSPTSDTARAIVEKYGGSGFGYSVPHWESVVEKTFPIEAQYIVGADGPNSAVRRANQIVFQRFAPARFFVVYEFESDDVCDEVRVVLRNNSADVLWPLPGNRARWTFQLAPLTRPDDFPEKEREHIHINEGNLEERICYYARQIAHDRAPWFTGGIREIVWRSPVQFEPRLVSELGSDRCWLVGDAAHQTLPFGMQSMNAGLQESKLLTDTLAKILCEDGSIFLLEDYSNQTREAWTELLAPESVHPHKTTSSWIQQHASAIVPCLPALGPDLHALAEQLDLTLGKAAPKPT